MSDDALQELNASLLALLQCPGCSTNMAAPMFLCRNGHTVCNRCRRAAKPCPVCRDKFTDTRNFFAEKTVAKVQYPCRHTRDGCSQKHLIKELAKHEASCSYRIYQCLAGSGGEKVKPCGWRGQRSKLHDHVSVAHKTHFSSKSEHGVIYKNFSLSLQTTTVTLIALQDDLFWWTKKRDGSKGRCVELVQYLGSQEDASKFRYCHEFRSVSGDQVFNMTNMVHSDTEDVHVIVQTGKCLVLDSAMLKNFVDSDNSVMFMFVLSRRDA